MEVIKLKETKETSTLYREMESLLDRISNDLMSTLVNLSGSLTDIGCGTRIKIPTLAGYVNFYKSVESYEISIWLKDSMMTTEPLMQKNNENLDEELK